MFPTMQCVCLLYGELPHVTFCMKTDQAYKSFTADCLLHIPTTFLYSYCIIASKIIA